MLTIENQGMQGPLMGGDNTEFVEEESTGFAERVHNFLYGIVDKGLDKDRMKSDKITDMAASGEDDTLSGKLNKRFTEAPSEGMSEDLYGESATTQVVEFGFKDNVLVLLSNILDIVSKRIDSKELQLFFYQCEMYTIAGVGLQDTVSFVSKDPAFSAKFRGVVRNMANEMGEGSSFADTVLNQGDTFPAHIGPLLVAADRSGGNDKVFKRLADDLEKQGELEDTIASAFRYPKIVLALMGVVFLGMVFFIMPEFDNLFTDMGAPTPGSIQMFINMRAFIIERWYITIIGLVGLFIGFKLFQRTQTYVILSSFIGIRLPVLGNMTISTDIRRFSYIVSLMLSSGIDIGQAFDFALESITNIVIKRSLMQDLSGIHEGAAPSEAMERSIFINSVSKSLFRLGDSIGGLDEVFNKVYGIYDAEVEKIMANIKELITPIVTAVIGLMAGGMIAVVYGALMTLTDIPI